MNIAEIQKALKLKSSIIKYINKTGAMQMDSTVKRTDFEKWAKPSWMGFADSIFPGFSTEEEKRRKEKIKRMIKRWMQKWEEYDNLRNCTKTVIFTRSCMIKKFK